MENITSIQTERLILREFTESDAKAIFSILSDPEVNTFLPMFPLKTMEEAKTYLNDHYLNQPGFHYAICPKKDNIPIGYINVSNDESHDLGYGLRKEFWHRGIVTEACRAAVSQLKRTGLSYLTATHDIKNPRSGEVMKKIGMTYRYSYEELWQPKNIRVIFRMYQLNLDGQDDRTFMKYWNQSSVRFVEKI